jgi:hypothetical protein
MINDNHALVQIKSHLDEALVLIEETIVRMGVSSTKEQDATKKLVLDLRTALSTARSQSQLIDNLIKQHYGPARPAQLQALKSLDRSFLGAGSTIAVLRDERAKNEDRMKADIAGLSNDINRAAKLTAMDEKILVGMNPASQSDPLVDFVNSIVSKKEENEPAKNEGEVNFKRVSFEDVPPELQEILKMFEIEGRPIFTSHIG